MSYSFLLQHKNGKFTEVPVSTHAYFHDFWLPLFEKLKLENLVNMQYSHAITEEELQCLISEYKIVKGHLTGAWEIERAEFIINELSGINFSDYEYINVG